MWSVVTNNTPPPLTLLDRSCFVTHTYVVVPHMGVVVGIVNENPRKRQCPGISEIVLGARIFHVGSLILEVLGMKLRRGGIRSGSDE